MSSVDFVHIGEQTLVLLPSLGYHDNLCGNNGTKPVYRNASTGREWRYFFKNGARLQVRFLTRISHRTRFRGESAGNV